MTGRHLTTTSPSRVSSRRRTPWVDGCCGPILTVRSSRLSVASIMRVHLASHGEIHRLAAERLGAPQRMTFPVVGQHDARKVRVPLEADAEEVIDLALVPVRPWNAG